MTNVPRLQRIRKSFVRQLLDRVPGLEFYLTAQIQALGRMAAVQRQQRAVFRHVTLQRAAIERTKMGLMDGQREAEQFIACCATNFC